MSFGFIYAFLALLLILALNWRRFETMGWPNAVRMLLIWGAIIAGMVLVLRLLGLG